MTNILTPDYLDIDFNTSKTRLKTLLSANPVFKDVDFEGANINVIMELISYLVSLNTYYLNMIAKNQYIPTSNMYETTHMLSQLGGYNPMGYRSSSTTLSIDISPSATAEELGATSASEIIIINEWSEISNSMGIVNSSGNVLKLITTDPTTTYPVSAMSLSNSSYIIPITAREGYIVRYEYTGTDVANNKIFIPANTYDYDDDLSDTSETIKLYVNDIKWTRISDWFENSEDVLNAYMFKYDKYGRYYIEFSSTRNIPSSVDSVTILAIVSSGIDGNIAAYIIDLPNPTFLMLEHSGEYLSPTCYTVSNPTASIGGSSPETIEEIKNSTLGVLHSQYRNVTKNDYIKHLETRADIVQANVWGEQEQSPSGFVQDYNKVYISLVPSVWDTSTCVSSAGTSTTPISAISYNATFTNDISEYLKPRKILTTYEQYVVPELLYFMFKIGLKIKANYTYTNVMADVRNKLIYYFDSYNRSFNERISFIDISEYLLDTSISSPTSDFAYVKGLRSLVMRDIDVVVYSPTTPYYQTKTIYEPNTIENYPYYVESSFSTDNKLRTIQLGYNQYPILFVASDTFSLEI